MIDLSVVVPVYNEGPRLDELMRRCSRAAEKAASSWELLLVDDGSSDATRAFDPDHPGVRVLHLPENRGQLQATCAGLAVARGSRVAVLDGDLQDPPEALPTLVEHQDVDVVFATTSHREDGLPMRLGSALYHRLQRWGRPLPHGAGSYCVMTRELARRAARVQLRDANLAAVLVGLGATWTTVPVPKHARVDSASRVGWSGLAREAVGSLAVTGALAPLGRRVGASCIVTGLCLGPAGWPLVPVGVWVGRRAVSLQNRVIGQL